MQHKQASGRGTCSVWVMFGLWPELWQGAW